MWFRFLAAAFALLLQVPAFAADCVSSRHDFGVLGHDGPVSFSGECAGGGDYGDPARNFQEVFSFTIDESAERLWGQMFLHPVRDLDPSSPTRGEFLYGLSITSITLSRDGEPASFIGTGYGIASAEWASFFAFDLLPGDYTLTLNGATFGLFAQGEFDAVMGVELRSAVPEASSVLLTVLGLVLIGIVLMRRRD